MKTKKVFICHFRNKSIFTDRKEVRIRKVSEVAKWKQKKFSFAISEQKYLHRPKGGKDTKSERSGKMKTKKSFHLPFPNKSIFTDRKEVKIRKKSESATEKSYFFLQLCKRGATMPAPVFFWACRGQIRSFAALHRVAKSGRGLCPAAGRMPKVCGLGRDAGRPGTICCRYGFGMPSVWYGWWLGCGFLI